jgi:hypothetical protein
MVPKDHIDGYERHFNLFCQGFNKFLHRSPKSVIRAKDLMRSAVLIYVFKRATSVRTGKRSVISDHSKEPEFPSFPHFLDMFENRLLRILIHFFSYTEHLEGFEDEVIGRSYSFQTEQLLSFYVHTAMISDKILLCSSSERVSSHSSMDSSDDKGHGSQMFEFDISFKKQETPLMTSLREASKYDPELELLIHRLFTSAGQNEIVQYIFNLDMMTEVMRSFSILFQQLHSTRSDSSPKESPCHVSMSLMADCGIALPAPIESYVQGLLSEKEVTRKLSPTAGSRRLSDPLRLSGTKSEKTIVASSAEAERVLETLSVQDWMFPWIIADAFIDAVDNLAFSDMSQSKELPLERNLTQVLEIALK